jgi:hypothetical protein
MLHAIISFMEPTIDRTVSNVVPWLLIASTSKIVHEVQQDNIIGGNLLQRQVNLCAISEHHKQMFFHNLLWSLHKYVCTNWSLIYKEHDL